MGMRRSRSIVLFCSLAALSACAADTPAGLDGGPEDAATDDAGASDGAVDAGTNACIEFPPPNRPHLAATEQGYVQGHMIGGVLEFLGMRYAAPPVGAGRWRPPEPAECIDAIQVASRFGPKCPQLDEGTFVGDEDCLQLNVWTPSVDEGARPVLVFIHGGGNAIGGAQEEVGGVELYRGDRLAEQTDSVVVTFNYRLGQLGWLVDPSLEDEPGRSGNYGTLDQIAALQWVRRNAAAFGGDPNKVLLFGESAGAVNTCMLLVSPLARGLFDAALIQSGGCPGYTRAQVEDESRTMVEESSCANAAERAECLRGLDAESVVRSNPANIQVAGRSSLYQPHVDGYVLLERPMLSIETGRHADVPLVIGANSDETSRAVPAVSTEQEYQAAVRALFGVQLGAEVLAQYPAANHASPRAALVRVTTDSKFVCPSRTIARRASDAPERTSEVYRYVFSHALDSGAARAFGAWHGLELTFVFGRLDIANYTPSAEERALSLSMQTFWSSLARDGRPSDANAATWEPYRSAADDFLRFDGGATAMDARFRSDDCDFWDDLTERLGG